jgi:photosystem I subunit 9
MVNRTNNQGNYLARYLSLAPVLAILSVSIAYSLFIIINYFFPDGLYMGLP